VLRHDGAVVESKPVWLRQPRHAALWQAAAAAIQPGDLSHDADHLRRVYLWALHLAAGSGVDPDLAGAAALLHDLVAIPKEAAERSEASRRSADAASSLLADAGYRREEAELIVDAVRTCSFASRLAPSGPLGALLQDADRLDAIGAVGVARSFSCAQGMAGRGRPLRLFDPEDPLAHGREPDEARFAVDHFLIKLLRLAEGMHLPAARAEALRRHQAMRQLLDELAREAAETLPEANGD
jgi:uncharacterized protein